MTHTKLQETYTKPQDVSSPRNRWLLSRVLHDGGESNWSAAEGQWLDDGPWSEVLAIRWNGNADAPIGNPQSTGHATWFIVPSALEGSVREAIARLPNHANLDSA